MTLRHGFAFRHFACSKPLPRLSIRFRAPNAVRAQERCGAQLLAGFAAPAGCVPQGCCAPAELLRPRRAAAPRQSCCAPARLLLPRTAAAPPAGLLRPRTAAAPPQSCTQTLDTPRGCAACASAPLEARGALPFLSAARPRPALPRLLSQALRPPPAPRWVPSQPQRSARAGRCPVTISLC